jgi:hypothetical protein
MLLVLVPLAAAFRTSLQFERGKEVCVGDFVEPRARVFFTASAAAEGTEFAVTMYRADTWEGARTEVQPKKEGMEVATTVWSDAGGVFIACVVSKKRTQELSLELVHGTEAVEAAAMEKHNHVPVSASRALDDTHMMLYEYRRSLHRNRIQEETMREAHEISISRLILCAVGNALLVLVVGIYQMTHLRSFFRSKKII